MIRLPAFFGNGMVIAKTAKIWGWTIANKKVHINFLDNTYIAESNSEGRFEATITSPEFGGPHELTIDKKVIKDVYVGRVWLCGGQSNMEMPLERVLGSIEPLDANSNIHVFQVEKGFRFDKPAKDVNGKWMQANYDDIEKFYAVPFYFAKQLLTDSEIPIGLICTPAGGTPIQGWMPEEIICEFPEYYQELVPLKEPTFVDDATEEANKKINAWHEELDANDLGIQEGWHTIEYDDSLWESNILLDSTGLPEYGSVWLRKTFRLNKSLMKYQKKLVMLYFGRVVNKAKVYVNGNLIHSVDYMYPPCRCEIPYDVLIDGVYDMDYYLGKGDGCGENLLTIRFIGDSNHPELIPGKDYFIKLESYAENEIIDLTGMWKRRIGKVMPRCESGVWFYNRPCGLYNYMLAPIIGCSIDGVIWYQGESNTGKPETYKALFTEFVKHMRKSFGEDLTIITTQLANFVDPYNTNFGENWAELREQQRQCYLNIPNIGMAVAIDCGEYNDLHPTNKETVGERLALIARRLVYNEDIVSDGPVVTKATFSDNKVTVYFDNAKGLWAKNGHPMLDLICEDGIIHRVYATIDKQASTLVACTAKSGDIKVKHVRFGWIDCPSVFLYNASNIPASPFEIGITQETDKYSCFT